MYSLSEHYTLYSYSEHYTVYSYSEHCTVRWGLVLASRMLGESLELRVDRVVVASPAAKYVTVHK